ncbi:MAG: alpha-amylase family glycosyl hydrolase [Candidatus Competibacteraceae bacterium]
MIIYNLFPLLAGYFSNWQGHIDRAADMGFDWIFVNPVQKPGQSGSLYSIADYFQLNPRLVDPKSSLSPEDQLRGIIHSAENRGIEMMVDLVINHCATDSKLAQEHPEWFIHEGDGRLAHPYCLEDGHKVVWEDLIQFNHRHTSDPEGLYRFFREIVEYLIGLGFKGFRCDAAYQLPDTLWRCLISETKHYHPEVIFTAETLGCSPQQAVSTASAGFDYVFNSAKWWNFEGGWLLEQYRQGREIAPSISFPESHDTERLLQENGGNVNVAKQRYLFTALFSAGVMMPIGFEVGQRKRLHVVDTHPDHWENTGIDLQDFIRKVNTIKRQHPIFQEEAINNLLHYDNPNILVMQKKSTKTHQEALIILNKDTHNRQYFGGMDLQRWVQNGRPLLDISPEYSTGQPPKPFHYDLNPGQGLVMVTQ